jgi:DNA-binding MarR family transcriptional regulator
VARGVLVEGVGEARRAHGAGEGESSMHFLMFRFKRAHLSSLRAARPFCEELEITPARFDFMRAATTNAQGTRQSRITKVLGLSSVAVSKMTRRLIELGLVTRERDHRDRRTFVVSLTEEGARRMREAYARISIEQPFQSLYERCFGPRSPITVTAVQNLDWAVRHTGWFIGDWSCEAFYRSKDPEEVPRCQ